MRTSNIVTAAVLLTACVFCAIAGAQTGAGDSASGPAASAPAASAPASSAPAARSKAAAGAPPQCYALLIGGLPGGEKVYASRFNDWEMRLYSYLVAARVPRENMVVLCGDKNFKSPSVSGESTAQNIRKALDDFAAKVRPQDQFVLMIVGHGTLADVTASMILPGPDMSATELADGMSRIASDNQVCLLFQSAGGEFVKPLAKANRVIVSATRQGDDAEPVFAEFFLRGLESKRADGESVLGEPQAPKPAPAAKGAKAPASTSAPAASAPAPRAPAGQKDDVITLLEAYNWATHQTALWILRQTGDATTNTWKTEGKESVEIFKKLCVGPAGEPGARKLDPASDASKPDAEFPLRIKVGEKVDNWWIGRRALNEHACLEDCGQPVPASALRDTYPGYESLNGINRGEPGSLARRVVLGRPDFLPPVKSP